MEDQERPRRGRPGHDRAAVVRTAVALFNERGYDATSVADLAGALGVTKSAVFHHVSSKEDLLAAALDEALEGLEQVVATAGSAGTTGTAGADVHPGGPAYDRLRATVEEAVRILAAHLPAVTLLLRVRGNGELERRALERRRVVDDGLAALVAAAAAEGALRADVPPWLASRLLFGTVNSLVEWYDPAGDLVPDELARLVASVVLDGLGARG